MMHACLLCTELCVVAREICLHKQNVRSNVFLTSCFLFRKSLFDEDRKRSDDNRGECCARVISFCD